VGLPAMGSSKPLPPTLGWSAVDGRVPTMKLA
jgi:hypothetical protein